VNWIHFTKDIDEWRAVVKAVMKLRVPHKVTFFFQLGTPTISNKHSAPSEVFRKTMKHGYYLRRVSVCLSVCPSVRMEQLGTHWTDFHYIWHLSVFRKSVKKIQVSLKSDKNNGYFTWRPIYIFCLSRSVLLRTRNVSDKSCRENQNTHFMCNNFSSKIVPFVR
jgi:hypothetical protein